MLRVYLHQTDRPIKTHKSVSLKIVTFFQMSEGQVKCILVWQRQNAASTTCTYLIHTHFQCYPSENRQPFFDINTIHSHPTCATDALDTYLNPDPNTELCSTQLGALLPN